MRMVEQIVVNGNTVTVPAIRVENGVYMAEQLVKGNTVTLPGTDSVPEGRMDSYYIKLQLERLLPEIRESVEVMDFHRAGIDSEMRARLLPALIALREKTKRQKPGFYDHLRAMGLTPGRVEDVVSPGKHRSRK